MAVKRPHILMASSNVRKLVENLRGVLHPNACGLLESAINDNTQGLYRLGKLHLDFAVATTRRNWRQRISRFYYAAYNARRSLQLHVDGVYRTDVSDHKAMSKFPDGFPRASTYETRMKDLRADRNLADYDHDSQESDLILSQNDAQTLVEDFFKDIESFLVSRGVTL